MANLFQNTTSGLGVLKQLFIAPLVDQTNQDVQLWNGLKPSKYKFTGSQVNRPIKVRRNPGIGAGSDQGNLPSTGRQTTVQANVAVKYNWLTFGVTGPMISASGNDAGSFVRIVAFEMEKGHEDFVADVNRQMGYDGTGYLARLNSAAVATTSITVKGREDTEYALKFLDVGMIVDIISSGSVVASGVTITAISGTKTATTATLTLDTAVTASANDYVVRTGAYNLEIQGVLTLFDGATSTKYGVDRSTYGIYNGNVIDKSTESTTNLVLDDLQRLQDTIESLAGKTDGQSINAIFSDFNGRRFYQKLLTADKRYSNTVKGDGSFSDMSKNYLEWAGIPWVADKDFPPKIAMLNNGCFEKMVQKEFEWADETGAPLIAQTGVDALEARMRFFANAFNNKPIGGGILKGYTSP